MKRLIAALAASVLWVSPAGAAPPPTVVLLPSAAVSGGGLAPGPDAEVNGSIGQPVSGFVTTAQGLHWSGFWSGEFTTPVMLAGIGNLKKVSDGAYVCLETGIATTDDEDFDSYFYIEMPDRSSGLRIEPLNGVPSGIRRGTVVTAFGTVETLESGERQLSAPVVTLTALKRPLGPVSLANRYVGGTSFGVPPAGGQYGVWNGYGLNNIGLLVRTWGTVTATGKGYIVVSDGSEDPVRVLCGLMIGGPRVGDCVAVTGISSIWLDRGFRRRCILTREPGDIVLL